MLRSLAPSLIQQRHLIAAFEWLCGTRYTSLAKFFPVLLKHLFDEEIVEEDAFLKWNADLTRNEYTADHTMISLDTLDQLKVYAQPFIVWIQEAEEEGDSDDEEESGSDDENN